MVSALTCFWSGNTKQAEKVQISNCHTADNCFLGHDRKEVLVVEFMQQGTTIMSEVYCKTLKNCIG
jgi:hypothetical protein